MGILDRFTTIIKANINDALDKAEDPAKMIDQYLIDLSEQLEQVKQETANVMADEKSAKRMVDENDAQIARMETLARKALTAGNEDDARTFLTKKQQLETKGAELQKTYEVAQANSQKLRQMHDKLVDDIDDLKARRQTIKAKAAVAETQARVNQITSDTTKASGTMDAFNRMEAKVDRMLDSQEALADLNAEPVDQIEALEEKYASAAGDSAVDDELERLKKEMGL